MNLFSETYLYTVGGRVFASKEMSADEAQKANAECERAMLKARWIPKGEHVPRKKGSRNGNH